MTAALSAVRARPPVRFRALVAGVVAGGLLLAIYLGIISLAQGPAHALEQLRADALFVGLISVGFGTQVALFAELWKLDRQHRAGAAVTAAATGTSAAAMLACCAHHVADLLPILGLSAAAVFVNAYKLPLFLLSLGMNAVGIAIIARQLRRARRACAVADLAPSD
jgi:hypothetical protein